MDVKNNIRLRTVAVSVVEFATELGAEAAIHGKEWDRYWEEIHKMVEERCPKRIVPEKTPAMTDEESKRFGREQMPYGEGEAMKEINASDVPIELTSWRVVFHSWWQTVEARQRLIDKSLLEYGFRAGYSLGREQGHIDVKRAEVEPRPPKSDT